MSVLGGLRTLPSQAGTDSGETDDWETSDVPRLDGGSTLILNRTTDTTTAFNEDDMDAPVSSFRDLQIMAPPPPAQDGGSFDCMDPFARQRQPSPLQQQQHALFDPNQAYPQSVSPAIATAAVSRFGPLDPVLLAGLENSRERLSLLKFEDAIVRFIKNPRESQLSFPPLSSYHRLIIHRLAERCCLEHQTADYNPYAHGYDGNASRVMTLFKTAQTVIPRVLLIDLSADKQQPVVTPASAPKIMVRKRAPPRGPNNGGRGQDGKNQQRTIEDRERAYAEARARIFGDDSSSSSASATESSATSTSSASPPTVDTANNTKTMTVLAPQRASFVPKMGGGHQAAGPDGSRGFGRGGRGTNGNGNSGQQPSKPQQQALAQSTPATGRGGSEASTTNARSTSVASSAPSSASDGSSAPPQQNWKEVKVLWRNREQEMNDPDFTRNHDAYRPSRDQQPTGVGGGGGGGGFYGRGGNGGGQQQQYYDGPRSYGYQNGPQPPFPGRGRGPPMPPPANEYNRIHAPPPPPPPSSEFYRGQQPHSSMRPPAPPPPGGYNSSYSPHARGGYSNAPPPPSTTRRGPGGPPPATGGYNDDFPPLGK